jgi:hypothetical protein
MICACGAVKKRKRFGVTDGAGNEPGLARSAAGAREADGFASSSSSGAETDGSLFIPARNTGQSDEMR